MNGEPLTIRPDMSPQELRRLARREPDRAAATRMQAIANALEGMTGAEAAGLRAWSIDEQVDRRAARSRPDHLQCLGSAAQG